jgi:hypothetical protein
VCGVCGNVESGYAQRRVCVCVCGTQRCERCCSGDMDLRGCGVWYGTQGSGSKKRVPRPNSSRAGFGNAVLALDVLRHVWVHLEHACGYLRTCMCTSCVLNVYFMFTSCLCLLHVYFIFTCVLLVYMHTYHVYFMFTCARHIYTGAFGSQACMYGLAWWSELYCVHAMIRSGMLMNMFKALCMYACMTWLEGTSFLHLHLQWLLTTWSDVLVDISLRHNSTHEWLGLFKCAPLLLTNSVWLAR